MLHLLEGYGHCSSMADVGGDELKVSVYFFGEVVHTFGIQEHHGIQVVVLHVHCA